MLRQVAAVLALLSLALCVLAAPQAAAEELRLLTEISPPAQMYEQGRLTGRTVELVREAMDRMGRDIPIQVLPWARAYQMARSGPMVGLFATTRTQEREKLFKWAGPLTELQWVFYARSDADLQIDSLEDARKVKRIGTYRSDAREEFLRSRGFRNLESVNNQDVNMRKLLMGRLDLVAGTNLGLPGMVGSLDIPPGTLEEVFAFRTMYLYLAFSLDVPDAEVARWNRTFQGMHEDGTFARIYAGWAEDAAVPPPPAEVQGRIMP